MAAANKVLEFVVRVKDRATATLGRVCSAALSFGKACGKAFAGIGKNLANIHSGFQMVGGVFRTVGSAVQSVARGIWSTIQAAFDVETAEANFRTLLGSAEAAKKHLNDLRHFANVTPFELSDVSAASRLLLSFGADVREVMPMMKTLGDISLGDAQRFQSLALVFAQVRSQGKLMGQDFLQMINAGFNPLEQISRDTGRSISELKKEMEEGAITFDIVYDAMQKAAGAGGKFNNAMLTASQTGNGLISTLSGAWTDALAEFGQAFVATAKNEIQYFIDALERFRRNGTIEAWSRRAKAALEPIALLLGNLLDSETRAGSFSAFGNGIKSVFEWFLARLKASFQYMGDMISHGIISALPKRFGGYESAQARRDAGEALEARYEGRRIKANADLKWDLKSSGRELNRLAGIRRANAKQEQAVIEAQKAAEAEEASAKAEAAQRALERERAAAQAKAEKERLERESKIAETNAEIASERKKAADAQLKAGALNRQELFSNESIDAMRRRALELERIDSSGGTAAGLIEQKMSEQAQARRLAQINAGRQRRGLRRVDSLEEAEFQKHLERAQRNLSIAGGDLSRLSRKDRAVIALEQERRAEQERLQKAAREARAFNERVVMGLQGAQEQRDKALRSIDRLDKHLRALLVLDGAGANVAG